MRISETVRSGGYLEFFVMPPRLFLSSYNVKACIVLLGGPKSSGCTGAMGDVLGLHGCLSDTHPNEGHDPGFPILILRCREMLLVTYSSVSGFNVVANLRKEKKSNQHCFHLFLTLHGLRIQEQVWLHSIVIHSVTETSVHSRSSIVLKGRALSLAVRCAYEC